MTDTIPLIRTSERNDFKRCEFQWYLRWRLGYVPRRLKTSLWFGTGWHRVMDARYPLGKKRGSVKAMKKAWDNYCDETYKRSIYVEKRDVDETEYMDARELGHLLIPAYVDEYGQDEEWEVLAVEVPFQIDVPSPTDPATTLAVYAGTMDKVLRHLVSKELWLEDHKTCRAFPDFRFLTLDDQAGSYVWVGPEVFRHLKIIGMDDVIEGIIFDYTRKGKPDTREMDANGQRLNLDGSVSKRQPTPLFHREYVYRSEYERVEMSRRVMVEAERMQRAREGGLDSLMKTPTKDCPTQCPVFELCEMHEQGYDWKELADTAFVQLDPYRDHREAMAEQDGVAL